MTTPNQPTEPNEPNEPNASGDLVALTAALAAAARALAEAIDPAARPRPDRAAVLAVLAALPEALLPVHQTTQHLYAALGLDHAEPAGPPLPAETRAAMATARAVVLEPPGPMPHDPVQAARTLRRAAGDTANTIRSLREAHASLRQNPGSAPGSAERR